MGFQRAPERVCQTWYKSGVFLNWGFVVAQENIFSCGTRRPVFLCHKKTRLLVAQEDTSSCGTRRHVFLWDKKTCVLVPQEELSSCATRKRVFLWHKKTGLLVPQEHMFSCATTKPPIQKNTTCIPCLTDSFRSCLGTHF